MGQKMNCPDPETLAEFIDGSIDRGERDAVVAHLADCDACRDVFAGAVEFQEQAAQPAPIADIGIRSPRRWHRYAAAVLFLVLGAAFATTYLRVPPTTASALAEAIDPSGAGIGGLGNHPWDNTRGDAPTARRQHEFRVGVLLMDLAVTSRGGLELGPVVAELVAELRSQPFNEHLAARYETAARSAADALVAALRAAEREVLATSDSGYHQLGIALEAVQLHAQMSPGLPVPNSVRRALVNAAGSTSLGTAPRGQLDELVARIHEGRRAGDLAEQTSSLVNQLGS